MKKGRLGTWILVVSVCLPALLALAGRLPADAASSTQETEGVVMKDEELRAFSSPHTMSTWTQTGRLRRGVTIGSVRDAAAGTTSTLLQQAGDMGMDVVLVPLGWDRLEVGNGEYDWKELEDILRQVDRYGLRVVLRVYNAPAWHRSLGSPATAPPSEPQALGDFMYSMIGHLNRTGFANVVSGYVIWNEPNIPQQWGGQPASAAAYMALLKAAYEGAKAANPDAVIVSAGLAPTETGDGAVNDLSYLEQMYDYGLEA